MGFKKITVKNKFQSGYGYFLTQPQGKNFDPEFKPELTPKQMLELGVFGGVYLYDFKKEFPKAWFIKAKIIPGDPAKEIHDNNLNYFKIGASQPLKIWQKNGWIHEQDPLGWFLWYCRYYAGRRSQDDQRQIKRWKNIKRHIMQIKKHCRVGDLTCRRRQRQAVLHWAYDSRDM